MRKIENFRLAKSNFSKQVKMNKKYILSTITFLIGMIITILGSLLKIMHWPMGHLFLTIGMLTEVFAITILIIVLLKNSK